jgi:hypothetical protein
MSYGTVIIPRTGTVYREGQFFDFLGGVNNSVSDEHIEQNELGDARNYTPDPENSGVLVKREGLSQVSSQQSAAFIGEVHDGIHDVWVALPTDVIDDSGTAQSLSLTSSTDCDWASINNFDIIVNGTEEKKYNGAAWSDLGGTPPNFKYIEVYNRFLFGAGHDKGKVRWSDPGDPETWDATNEWNLTPDANDDIVGLKRFRDVLVVFTERSFFHLRGYEEKAIAITYRGQPGCTSHRSIVATPFGLYWFSDDGIYWSPDGFQIENISQLKIAGTMDGLNKDKLNLIHGLWNPLRQRVEWYVFDGTSTTQDLAIFYYPRIGTRTMAGVPLGSFWLQSGAGVQMAASGVVTVSGERRVYLGAAATNKYLYHCTGDTDDGTDIEAYLETKRDSTEYGPNAIKRSKTLLPIFELAGSATVYYGIYINNSSGVTESWALELEPTSGFILGESELGTGELGAAEAAQEIAIGYSEKFRKLKHRIYDQNSQRTKVRGIRTEGYLVSV